MAKGGNDDKSFFPQKTMIDFEGEILDVFTIQGVTKGIVENDDSEMGMAFSFTVQTSTFNANPTFVYSTIVKRDSMIKKFKAKLITVGVAII